jgi:hypothetical protein
MNEKQYKFLGEKNYFERKKTLYEGNGTVNWATFAANQEINKGKVVLLANSDFANGTLRIKAPCMLKFTENISFNPNRPTTWLNSSDAVTSDFSQAVKIDPNRALDWNPDISAPNNSQYFEPEVKFAYSLGFFAAITVESSDVIINLNGYKLDEHLEHYVQQKFYSHIELSDQPFIPMEGPTNFGNILRSAKHCWIYGGTLGRSSHHCIHGNDCDNIIIEDIAFSDFEVGALALNGGKNIYLNNLTVDQNHKNVFVLGTYSAGRLIRGFVKQVQDQGQSTTVLNNALTALNNDLDETFNSIIFNNGTIPTVFDNPISLMDGNAHGIIINPKGVAVNNFLEGRNSNRCNETTNICMFNCSINSIHNKIIEVIAVDNGNGSPQVDTAGAVFRFFDQVSTLVDDKYYYQGTSLSNVQVELAKVKKTMDDASLSTAFLGTLNIQEGIRLWKDNGSYYFKVNSGNVILYDGADTQVLVGGNPVVYKILCNGDSMFHVNKGCFGLKVDGANGMYVENCSVSDIKNLGEKGSLLAGNYLGSHPSQGSMVGYFGARTFGAIFSAVNDLKIDNFGITSIVSENASAEGLILQNGSCNVSINNVSIDTICSNENGTFDNNATILPNLIPISKGIYIGPNLFNINLDNISVSNVKNPEGTPFDNSYDIQSLLG